MNIGFGMIKVCFTCYGNNLVEITYYIGDKHMVLWFQYMCNIGQFVMAWGYINIELYDYMI